MKKILVIAAAIFCCAALNAQNIWLKAGYGSTSAKVESKSVLGTVTDQENLNGFFVGGEYEIGVGDIFSIAPGAEFAFRTYKESELGVDSKLTEMGINIPIVARAGFDLGSVRVFANVGPDFYLGITSKATNTSGSLTDTEDMFEDFYNRFDLGVLFGIGAELQGKYRVFCNYDLGVLNTCKVDDCTRKNNTLQFGIGLCF